MKVEFHKISPKTLLLQWENPSPYEILASRNLINSTFSESILECVPAFKELAVYLHLSTDINDFKTELASELQKLSKAESKASNYTYHIPLCYGQEFGPDLSDLAESNGLSEKEVIQLHTEGEYLIHFLGFLPGFPYLSGLNPKLHKARLASPRQKISAGSVGIAGDQTGIYPQASPGGWNIIGRSPLKLFNVDQDPPTILQPMNKIKFVPIEKSAFHRIEKLVKEDKYQIKISND